jgi:Mg-chelatase subunit ChlD
MKSQENLTNKTKYLLPILILGSIIFFFTRDASAKNILFIVDGSNSMWAEIEKKKKIEITKKVLGDRIRNLPDAGVNAGLMVYGHRRQGDCNDIEQMVELKPLDKPKMIAKINSIKPRGKTPMAASIELAVKNLENREDKTTIILMTDGKETCSNDPCGVIEKLKEQAGDKFILNVVGFDIVDEKDALQLKCLAEAGGGRYYTAATIVGLDEAFKEVTFAKSDKSPEIDLRIQENIEVILDTSSPMQRPFDNTSEKTRLDTAKKALKNVLKSQVADRDNLAFRQFGGSCDGENTHLVVEFGQNNSSRIVTSLGNLRTGGNTTLVDAVLYAAEDFNDPKRFKGVSKRVIIIAGSIDPCFRRKADETIRMRLEKKKIKPVFRFIGFRIPYDQGEEFKNIAKATQGGYAFANTQEQLEKALYRFLEVEPVLNDLETIIKVQNNVIQELRHVENAISAKNYATAKDRIMQAHQILKGTIPPFKDLGRRRAEEVFKQAFENARTIRTNLNDSLEIIKTLVHQAETNDIESYNKSVVEYNQKMKEYNRTAKEDNILRRRLREFK